MTNGNLFLHTPKELCAFFDYYFPLLSGHTPFPWQRALFVKFTEPNPSIPRLCHIPTGLGKTAVMTVWLLALAYWAKQGQLKKPGFYFPRRLVYIVNRRTVVDQATVEALTLRSRLSRPEAQEIASTLRQLSALESLEPFAVSTLRGELADNAEWREDPSRPAIIVGTVDMIGSRLLFSGYGLGFRSQPHHAALLGCDALIVHDEAHLEPAFQELLEFIANEVERDGLRPLRVMALTATAKEHAQTFGLTPEDYTCPEEEKRLYARKVLRLTDAGQQEHLAQYIAEKALKFADSRKAILVYTDTLQLHSDVVQKLRAKHGKERVEVLTGTLRGYERDNLLKKSPVFARFLLHGEKSQDVEPIQGTVYLVCTSAGEVGINISADHLVCDLVPLERMIQRFGRVNRFGDGEAEIEVVYAGPQEGETKKQGRSQRVATHLLETLEALKSLPKIDSETYDASLQAISNIPMEIASKAFSPAPATLPFSQATLDAWAMTTPLDPPFPRPPVDLHLHGLTPPDDHDTYVAWREEVTLICEAAARLQGVRLEGISSSEELEAIVAEGHLKPSELLEHFPLKPHELLRDRTDRVLKHLKAIARRRPTTIAWLLKQGEIRVGFLNDFVSQQDIVANAIVLLPPEAGGLSEGCLDGKAEYDPEVEYDVAEKWFRADGRPYRQRTWDDEEPLADMRLLDELDTRPDIEDSEELQELPERRVRKWFATSAAQEKTSIEQHGIVQELKEHEDLASKWADRLVTALGLSGPEAQAVVFAAKWHDRGKSRAVWQKAISNEQYPAVLLAKAKKAIKRKILARYRHELGSLIDVLADPDFQTLPEEVKNLVLHLIAAHHGRARPAFPDDEDHDQETPASKVLDVVKEVPRRFAVLQRRYGWWGLAWLESLVRAADAMASTRGASNG